jgi:hypothetical protein
MLDSGIMKAHRVTKSRGTTSEAAMQPTGLMHVHIGFWAAALVGVALAALGANTTGAESNGWERHFYTSLFGVHVAGYQGWFTCPGDGAPASDGAPGWSHWFFPGADARNPNSLAGDQWPDTSELGRDELCPTPFHLSAGGPAFLFSDQNPKTVARHFAWMRKYNIDGAAMQRFTWKVVRPDLRNVYDKVLANARSAAEVERRGFFVMYDISGMRGADAVETIKQDWRHLTENLHLTDSPAYMFDHGKPVVGVWGFGFKDRDISPAQALAITRYLHSGSRPATVIGGVPTSWRDLGSDGRWPDSRTQPEWASVYRALDVISPWTVGRFRDDAGADAYMRDRLLGDIDETRRLGIEYMPVVFPGFSWRHGAGSKENAPLNAIPRRCGAFYSRQIRNALGSGARMLYTAMFDEVGEATAIFKVAAEPGGTPAGTELLALDADGCDKATSDMYLVLAGRATRTLRLAVEESK